MPQPLKRTKRKPSAASQFVFTTRRLRGVMPETNKEEHDRLINEWMKTHAVTLLPAAWSRAE